MSEIEVLPLPSVTASKAGYAVLKTAFLRDRSWLPSYLTSIRTIFLPMISRKFAYVDDLALLHSSGNWKDLEGTLSQDISTLSAYLQTWRLKLSHTKTVTTAFHLNKQESKCELKVYNNRRLLPFCPIPTYLGVKLDRSLTFCPHLVALRKNYPRASHC